MDQVEYQYFDDIDDDGYKNEGPLIRKIKKYVGQMTSREVHDTPRRRSSRGLRSLEVSSVLMFVPIKLVVANVWCCHVD